MSDEVTAAQDGTSGLVGSFAASLFVLLIGLAFIYQATAGGTAFTTETLRRSAVAQAPVAVPDFTVADSSGRVQTLRQLLAASSELAGAPAPATAPAPAPAGTTGGSASSPGGGKVWIVDFVYTRCASVCLSLGTVFQQLQAEIESQGLQDRVGLLSISFDALHDQPPALADYARRMRMQPGLWQLVSLRNESDRRRLLDSFGIMVLPAPLGEFEHNAALHLVTPDGRLVRILGLDEGQRALMLADSLSSGLGAARAVAAAAR